MSPSALIVDFRTIPRTLVARIRPDEHFRYSSDRHPGWRPGTSPFVALPPAEAWLRHLARARREASTDGRPGCRPWRLDGCALVVTGWSRIRPHHVWQPESRRGAPSLHVKEVPSSRRRSRDHARASTPPAATKPVSNSCSCRLSSGLRAEVVRITTRARDAFRTTGMLERRLRLSACHQSRSLGTWHREYPREESGPVLLLRSSRARGGIPSPSALSVNLRPEPAYNQPESGGAGSPGSILSFLLFSFREGNSVTF